MSTVANYITATPNPIRLTVPDVRSDCAWRLARMLRDIYYLAAREGCKVKNTFWAKKLGIAESSVRDLIAVLKSHGLVTVTLIKNRDRIITPCHPIEVVGALWVDFRSAARRMLPASVFKKSIPKPEQKPAILESQPALKNPVLAPETPEKSQQLRVDSAPNSAPPPIKVLQVQNAQRNVTRDSSKSKTLNPDEEEIVSSLVSLGVEKPTATRLVRSMGTKFMGNAAKFLTWNIANGIEFRKNPSAWLISMVAKMTKPDFEYPNAYVGLRPIAKGEKSEESKIRDARHAEEASRIHDEAEAVLKTVKALAVAPPPTPETTHWETLDEATRERWLEVALAEIRGEMAPTMQKSLLKNGTTASMVQARAKILALKEV
jgi:hypothetical protein